MATSPESGRITRIIACGVFKPVMEHIAIYEKNPNIKITYLPSVLHLRPPDLKNFLVKEINAAQKRDEEVICLYGWCFPDIEEICKQHNVTKVPGTYCYEMFLGPDRFNQIMNETAGSYFMEKDLITNFEQHCKIPLELHDETMRRYCFEHYTKLVYVRQPADPDLTTQVDEIADLLELVPDIRDADYSYLENKLIELIDP